MAMNYMLDIMAIGLVSEWPYKLDDSVIAPPPTGTDYGFYDYIRQETPGTVNPNLILHCIIGI